MAGRDAVILSRVRGLSGVLALLWLLLAALPLRAGSLPVAVLGSSDQLRAEFAAALTAVADQVTLVPPAAAQLWVALGDDAFQQALAGDRPVWGVGIARAQLLAALERGCHCSGSFAENDPHRQLQLLHWLFPRAKRVGVLVGPDSQWQLQGLQDSARALDLQLQVQAVTDQTSMARQLPRLLAHTDVLLGVSDSALFNAASARLVLLTGYRQQVPVVGPGEVFVRAGSVASSYSTLEDYAADAALALTTFRAQRRWPQARFPVHFSVLVNQHVARAYDVPWLDEQQLQQLLGGTP